MSAPQLIVVPTPIGNLEDITLRGLRMLKEADLILAEDTRTSQRLLQEYQITTPLSSYHMHNEHQVVNGIVQKILSGTKVCLISDAGTPGISDPGYLLIRACIESQIDVICLPGPTALIPALVSSGLPSERFFYEGFLPPKKGRLTRISSLKDREVTTILYESPLRVVKLIEELMTVLNPSRKIVVARELSKKFEELHRGSLSELLVFFKAHPPIGEIVILIAPTEREEKVHQNKYKMIP